MTVQRKRNIAGFYDGHGRFRPIRSPQFVGSPKRRATKKQKAKYSKAKAGDLGKERQERALEDVFDREIRREREQAEKAKRFDEKLNRELERDAYGEAGEASKGKTLVQFVRSSGGITETKNDKGELRPFTFKESRKRGLVVKSGGKTLDYMYQAARESGYDVESADDLLSRMEDEINGYSPMYKTHGTLSYNPAKSFGMIEKILASFLAEFNDISRENVEDVNMSGGNGFIRLTNGQGYWCKLTSRGVKKDSWRSEIMNGVLISDEDQPTKLAKAAISAFDTDYDLDLDLSDVRRLRLAEKRRKEKFKNRPVPSWKSKKNPVGTIAAGQVLTSRAITDYDTVFKVEILERKGSFVKVQTDQGEIKRVKVYKSTDGEEYIMPYGKYSMAPMFRAKKNPVGKVDKNRQGFVKFLKLRGYDQIAKDVSNGADIRKAIETIYGFEPPTVKAKLKKLHGLVRKQNPLNPIMAFAAGASGILSALQIKEHITANAVKKTIGKTTAKRKTAASKNTMRKNPAAKMAKDEFYLRTIYKTDGSVRSVHVYNARTNASVKRFKTAAAAKKYATTNGIELVKNPTDPAKAKTPSRSRVNPRTKSNGIISRYRGRRKAKKEYAKELRLEAAIDRSRSRRKTAEAKARANPAKGSADYKAIFGLTAQQIRNVHTISPAFWNSISQAQRNQLGREALDYLKNGTKTRKPVPSARKNPVKVPVRRTFEMFQGRPATTAKTLAVSKHAPARLDQLGDLIEIKLDDGQVLKMNPKRFKLCASGGKLWIAGGKFAKPNPAGKANELNPIAKIDHVVYGTRKPHHGDNAYTHYIHRLGEESGHRPTLAVDREGFPVLRGGQYKIEARGIVN